MTSRDFAFWLQGYFELLDPKMEAAPFPLGPAQVKSIRDHLQLVFTHDINPPKPAPAPALKHDQQKAQEVAGQSILGRPPLGITYTGTGINTDDFIMKVC